MLGSLFRVLVPVRVGSLGRRARGVGGRRRWAVPTLALAALLPGLAASAADYAYSRVGRSADVSRSSTGGLLLAGGGSDVDEAMGWLKNNAAGGDVVVLRASGGGEYNRYLYDLPGTRPDSVETIVFQNRNASFDATVRRVLEGAEAVFIAGGDQARYLAYWKGTPVEDVLAAKLAGGRVTVGGTSAGMAVLGGSVYSAANGTVYSDEALDDPFNRYMTFEWDFLRPDFMTRTVTDTHFSDRDRDGRMMGFLARLQDHHGTSRVYGIGVDEGCALTVDTNGAGTVRTRYGDAYAKFFRPTAYASQLVPGRSLTLEGVEVWRMNRNSRFDLRNWRQVSGGTRLTYDARGGRLTIR